MSEAERDNWTVTWCPQCGHGVSVDEDGLCVHCGADAVGEGAEDAHRILNEHDRDRERLSACNRIVEAAEAWADWFGRPTWASAPEDRLKEAVEEYRKLRKKERG